MIVDLVGVIKSLFKTKPNGAVFGVVTESIFTQNKRYFSPKSMKIDFLEFSIDDDDDDGYSPYILWAKLIYRIWSDLSLVDH